MMNETKGHKSHKVTDAPQKMSCPIPPLVENHSSTRVGRETIN